MCKNKYCQVYFTMKCFYPSIRIQMRFSNNTIKNVQQGKNAFIAQKKKKKTQQTIVIPYILHISYKLIHSDHKTKWRASQYSWLFVWFSTQYTTILFYFFFLIQEKKAYVQLVNITSGLANIT